jgi:vancomycin resistance protein VanJ
MTRADTAETGQGGAGRRETGSGTRRVGIHRAFGIGFRLGPWKRGLVLAALALLLALVMLLHAEIPERVGNLGSLVETFLPWLGLFIPVLLAGAIRRRSASAVAALLLPAVAWLNLFGGVLSDKSHRGTSSPWPAKTSTQATPTRPPPPATWPPPGRMCWRWWS